MNSFIEYAKSLGGYLISRDLRHLIVHVTNHCNFRCKHCFIDFSPKRDMKLEQYEKLGREVGTLLWMDIGGGEPFLRKDLADIVAAFDAKIVQIPSNGSLPDLMVEQIERMLALGDREIILSLSLDGLEETHNRIRGQESSWDDVWSTFERLKTIEGLYVKILTVLQDSNADEIIPLMQEVRRRKPDQHSIILVRGDTIDASVCLPPMDELRKLGREIFAIQESYDHGSNRLAARILRNFHRYNWKVSLRTLEEKRQVIPCLAGKAHMVVLGDGRVSSCEMLEPIGNVRDQDWDEILQSDAFKRQVGDIEAGKCYCTHNCAMFDSIFFSPVNSSKLLHQTID